MTAPHDALLETLAPLLELVADLPLDDCGDAESAARLVEHLEQRLPAQGPVVEALGRRLRTGVQEGWLCDRGEPGARFCRVAKASPRTRDLSVDVVDLSGSGLRHRHPRGEVTLGWPSDPDHDGGRFDGHPPGWVVMPAGSIHTPTVTGPGMLLLYFLPGGAAEWNPPE